MADDAFEQGVAEYMAGVGKMRRKAVAFAEHDFQIAELGKVAPYGPMISDAMWVGSM